MKMHQALPRKLLLSAAALLTSACFSVDDSLVREAGKDAGSKSDEVVCPQGYVCTPVEWGEPDAEIIHPPEPNPPPDGGVDPVDPPEPTVQIECNEDGHCPADMFCSVSGFCAASCTKARGCVVPKLGRVRMNSLLRTRDGVLYATPPTWTINGNEPGEVWLLKQDGSSTKLVTGLYGERLKMVVDDQVYLERWDSMRVQGINQASLAGGTSQSVELPTGGALNVVASPGYLWWATLTRNNSDGPWFELWRRARSPGAQDEKVKDVRGQDLLAATDSGVYYSFYAAWEDGASLKSDLMYDDLSGATPRLVSRVGSAWSQATLIQNRIVGHAPYGQPLSWLSVPLSGSDKTLELVPELHGAIGTVATDLGYDAPWLYWSETYPSSADQSHVQVGRSHPELAFETELLVDFEDAEGSQCTVAPWLDEVVCYSQSEQRLFRLPIPAPRCSASVACPSGRSCQPDNTCR